MDELYVVARRALLDALEALGAHRDAIIVVGAQAIYLRVGDAELAVAPYTTDGDLALDPALLAEIPPIEQALAAARFVSGGKDAVGVWFAHIPTSTSPDLAVASRAPSSTSTRWRSSRSRPRTRASCTRRSRVRRRC